MFAFAAVVIQALLLDQAVAIRDQAVAHGNGDADGNAGAFLSLSSLVRGSGCGLFGADICCARYDCSPEPKDEAQQKGDTRKPCADILADFLNRLVDFLDSLNIAHSLCYGTVLGAVRLHDIIPWTADIDIHVPEEAFPKLINATVDHSMLRGLTFRPEPNEPVKTMLRGCQAKDAAPGATSEGFMPYIDVYSHKWYGDETSFFKGGSSNLVIRGRNFKGPEPVDKYLKEVYGENYMTPDPNRDPHGR
uniref:LicD/FKTN/FKRP nucleotidyltransferase domain-containing protein n=1 Tax=Zooxanthella nutricula TaxID=1333877 RepID=A0A7S2NYN8_9DINO